jgi:hypothetical protein
VGILLIVRTDCVTDLGVTLDSKLHLHRHVDYLYSQILKLLRLILFITYNLSSLHSMKALCIVLILSGIGYASVDWDDLTLLDSNKLEDLQKSLQIYAIIGLFSPIRFVIKKQC